MFLARGQAIELDDIKVLKEPCSGNPDSCDFENGQCQWKNAESVDFDWLLGSGAHGGPIPHDHTTGTANGHYMFLPIAPPLLKGSVARLIAPEAFQDTVCLNFFFFAKAKLVDVELRVVAITGEFTGFERKTVWAWSKPTDDWTEAQAVIDNIPTIYVLFFEAYFDGANYGSTVAIDDVSIANDTSSCNRLPNNAVPDASSKETNLTSIVFTLYLFSAQDWLLCQMNSDFCMWTPTTTTSESSWNIEKDPLDNGKSKSCLC